MFNKIYNMINNNPVKVIVFMAVLIVAGAVVTSGFLNSDENKVRYDELVSAYEFMVDEEAGIGTWTTEEAWKAGVNRMIELCPKDSFTKSAVYGDNEELRQMIRNIRRVKFNDAERAELAELAMTVEIEDTSKGNKHRLEILNKDVVHDVNYLTGIRMVY